jgi:hypothetical protein
MDQLEDLQQGINMRQSEFDALSARYDELAPLADIVPGLNTQLLDLNTQLNARANEIRGCRRVWTTPLSRIRICRVSLAHSRIS